ncbi:Site-specific recombinase, DNA invertase Pin-like protein [Rubellimicrobium mesophilum DSM 19309]|uniref:Site-specific recombinase, DNA invertase Pin-like protein n=1 Tax=Rubellimicrobium mesophilum DSM 19309 TaxID=442562 RepID=A0A017HMZ2_9RHOB|nr:Site-specific recombinase, DNA invertase Pin-like protein [Rubellimicrobium mesophilum DSM 19309]
MSARASGGSRPQVRCAIYTRKSSEEGLGQEFNSLDAQREACAAYVASQKHEGWKLAPEHYDDGGLSGGTLERPALQRLLADIDAGRVQMVVVYKIDRLTRSLADFAKLVERLETAGCSFVSVTQAFNTSSSMGRLTLNVLLSFAQFEREVTAERIRDKVAASKRKGMWMGGMLPLGYDRHPDPQLQQLVVNEPEAEQVRRLFRLYDELGCLGQVERAAAARGITSKPRVTRTGQKAGGLQLTRGQIHHLLTNITYRGLTKHKDEAYPGLHPAIVEQDLWDKVQARMQEASARPRGRRGRLAAEVVAAEQGNRAGAGREARRSDECADRAADGSWRTSQTATPSSTALPSPLTGKLRDDTGDRLTPTHSVKAGRRIRYYASHRLITGPADPSGWRLPAPTLEEAVAAMLAEHLARAAEGHALLAEPDAQGAVALRMAAAELAAGLREPSRRDDLLRRLVASGEIGPGRLALCLDSQALADALATSPEALSPAVLACEAPIEMRRRGVELKIVAGERAPAPDRTLLRTLAKAHAWAFAIRKGEPVIAIARRESRSESFIRSRAELAFLSPRIQEAILDGRQPVDLTLERIIRTPLPLDWSEQERVFGFAS